MRQIRKQLRHLAQAYFHQDFDLESPTPLGVVLRFRAGEPSAAVDELVADIESVLDSAMTDSEMRELWVDEYGASYDPRADGIDYRRWFAEIVGTLTSS